MKRMYSLIAILVVFLGVAFFNESGGMSLFKPSTPTVGVLQLMHHPALDQIYHGFRHQLAKEGYHNGKNVKVEYQNAQGDQSNLKTMAGKLANDHPKVLVGITTPASQALANTDHKTPIVMGAVSDPRTAGLVKNLKHPGGHITGVSDLAPVAEQLATVKEFMPHLKTLGIIYTSSDASANADRKVWVQLCKKEHIRLKQYSISNSNDLNQVSQQMMTQVDAVVVPTDNVIASAMQTLVKNANAAKKPVFPAADTMVKDGGLATRSLSQYKLGEEAGKLTVDIIKGQKPGNIAVRHLTHGEPVVNLKEARKLGIHVPHKFLRDAQQNGEVIK